VDNPELPDRNGETEDITKGNATFQVCVDGLSPSTTYNCVAYITNESGSSETSSNVTFITEQVEQEEQEGKLA
jgi:hypothetical protein